MNSVRIVWDDPKRQANIEKHGFDFADLTEAFFAASVAVPAKAGRFVAIGELGETVVAVVAGARDRGDRGYLDAPGKPKGRELLHG